jgi:2-polyprenyl-3-methyl-5-hydroxy-6-metoxy-1,4-benzoquinol methylase
MADFDKVDHWDSFYGELAAEDVTQHDWFGVYSEFRPALLPHLPHMSAQILHVGCGTSTLTADLCADGWHNITSIDYSHVCVQLMRAKYADTLPATCPYEEVKSDFF